MRIFEECEDIWLSVLGREVRISQQGEDIWWQSGWQEVRILRRRGYLGGNFGAEGEDSWVSVLGLPLSRLAEGLWE